MSLQAPPCAQLHLVRWISSCIFVLMLCAGRSRSLWRLQRLAPSVRQQAMRLVSGGPRRLSFLFSSVVLSGFAHSTDGYTGATCQIPPVGAPLLAVCLLLARLLTRLLPRTRGRRPMRGRRLLGPRRLRAAVGPVPLRRQLFRLQVRNLLWYALSSSFFAVLKPQLVCFGLARQVQRRRVCQRRLVRSSDGQLRVHRRLAEHRAKHLRRASAQCV